MTTQDPAAARAQLIAISERLLREAERVATHLGDQALNTAPVLRRVLRRTLAAIREIEADIHAVLAAADEALDPAAAWNATYEVGQPVRYWPGERKGPGRLSRTRSNASMLDGYAPVVWVDGYASCIALSHVEPIDEAELAAAEAGR